MINMVEEYGPLGDGRRTNMGNLIHLRRTEEMAVVDEEFAGLITQSLAVAGWSVSEACREAGIPWSALEHARLGNRVLSVKYIHRLVVALMEKGQGEAALMLCKPFLPEGMLIRLKGIKNNYNTWRDEVAAMQMVIEQVVIAIEDGRVDLFELETIERAAHVAAGMVIDQVEECREKLRSKHAEPRIAGAKLRATG